VTDRPQPAEFSLLLKGELEFRASAAEKELEVQVWDYHAEPVHLSLEDLERLGLLATEQREALLKSEVAPWRQALRERGGKDLQPPRLREDASAQALHIGGMALLPVAEGVDVYVISYDSTPVRLELHHLARLGLQYRGA
jgi:hypothetical protein